MTHVLRGSAPRSRNLLTALLALALLALLAPAGGQAAPQGKKASGNGGKITVMSRNVYLGADLGPALNASNLDEAIDGAGEIYNEIEETDFTERALPLGREIARTKPDLVGLQEVALWREQIPSDGGWTESGGFGEPAQDVKYDFLALLMDGIDRAGGDYKIVGVQEEFDAELPADIDDNNETGPLFGADLDARLTMRDVILVRKGSKVKAPKRTVEKENFETLYTANVGGIEITAERGWLSVEAKYRKNQKSKAEKFRFVNTHLEAFGDPEIREAQARELFAKGGPLRSKGQVVLVGDLNSGIRKHNIGAGGGGSADPDDQLAFRALKKFGMKDRGAVQTCCYPDMFDPLFEFTHTVDHVMVKPKLKLRRSFVTGDDPKAMTPSGLWPSDHGGVVSKLGFKGGKKK